MAEGRDEALARLLSILSSDSPAEVSVPSRSGVITTDAPNIGSARASAEEEITFTADSNSSDFGSKHKGKVYPWQRDYGGITPLQRHRAAMAKLQESAAQDHREREMRFAILDGRLPDATSDQTTATKPLRDEPKRGGFGGEPIENREVQPTTFADSHSAPNQRGGSSGELQKFGWESADSKSAAPYIYENKENSGLGLSSTKEKCASADGPSAHATSSSSSSTDTVFPTAAPEVELPPPPVTARDRPWLRTTDRLLDIGALAAIATVRLPAETKPLPAEAKPAPTLPARAPILTTTRGTPPPAPVAAMAAKPLTSERVPAGRTGRYAGPSALVSSARQPMKWSWDVDRETRNWDLGKKATSNSEHRRADPL